MKFLERHKEEYEKKGNVLSARVASDRLQPFLNECKMLGISERELNSHTDSIMKYVKFWADPNILVAFFQKKRESAIDLGIDEKDINGFLFSALQKELQNSRYRM